MLIVPRQWKAFEETYVALAATVQQLGYRAVRLTFPDCVIAQDPLERCGIGGGNASASGAGATAAAVTPRRKRIYITASFCSLGSHAPKLPMSTVLWQLEPLADAKPACLKAMSNPKRLPRMTIWDYSRLNILLLRAKFGPGPVLRHAPFWWYPGVTDADWSSPPAPEARERQEDIDVVFLAWLEGKRRPPVVRELQRRNVSVHTGMVFGHEREALLQRAKIVLNVHFYESRLLETVRLHYVLSQRRFVISEVTPDKEAQAEYSQAVVFAKYEALVDTVQEWLRRPASDRHEVADRGYDYIRSRSMVDDYGPLLKEAEQHALV